MTASHNTQNRTVNPEGYINNKGGSSMKKNLVILGAVALTAAAAVPALAFENEFHGMFRAYGWMSNALSGGAGLTLAKPDRTNTYMEQRARLQYIAKASDDLKLVTHFELDTLFGGANGAKYQSNDAGALDADSVTLETKNVYLDFNIPNAPVNVKLGLQPYNDAYQGTFGNFDGTGVLATAKFNAFTPSIGWFRTSEEAGTGPSYAIGKATNDLLVVDGKFAVNKDFTVGANYMYFDHSLDAAQGAQPSAFALNVHTIGLNTSAKVGPATINAFLGYQFGDATKTRDLSAYGGALTAKIKAGPGNVNLAGLYLSGDKQNAGNGDINSWQSIASNGNTSYFNASNMWLLIRNGATINSSASIGTNDLTKGGRGIMGLFAGYEGTAGKVFYGANAGIAHTAVEKTAQDGNLGTELNANVGYKLYDNMSAQIGGAYAFLGDGMNSDNPAKLMSNIGAVQHAENPYLTYVRVDYTF